MKCEFSGFPYHVAQHHSNLDPILSGRGEIRWADKIRRDGGTMKKRWDLGVMKEGATKGERKRIQE